MSIDTVAGAGKATVGKGKQAIGDAIGSPSLKGEGVADEFSGRGRETVGRLKDFARRRPVLATTLAGVLGVALLNTLRGK